MRTFLSFKPPTWDNDAISTEVPNGIFVPFPLTVLKGQKSKKDTFKEQYFSRLDDLARRIYQKISTDGVPQFPSVDDKDKTIPDDSREGSTSVIYLAETTDDLESKREEVKRFLSQAGMQVVPDSWLPRDPEQFNSKVEEDLARADLFVQLLSPIAGRRVEGIRDSYSAEQFYRAEERELAILQWRDSNLDFNQVDEDTHYKLLTNPFVRSIPLAEFKKQVLGEAIHLSSKKNASKSRHNLNSDLPFVFVNVNSIDIEYAKPLCQMLENANVEYAVPLTQGTAEEFIEDLQGNLIDCDAFVVVYGKVPTVWVREQLRLWKRNLHKRKHPPKILAIYETPPEDKEVLGMKLKGMQVIDSRNGFDPALVQALLDELTNTRVRKA